MDTNCTGGRFVYYKDPINCQPNVPSYSDAYGTSYPIEGEVKDRRMYPPGHLYYQPNYKADIDFRNDNKTIPPKTPYTNYGVGGPFKESNYYTYYDQFKYNIGSANNFSQFSKTLNYPNYQTSPYPNSNVVVGPPNFCDEANLALKSLPKTSNANLAQYNYPNYYGYSATPAYPSQNICNYNYSEESRLLWEDYQNNRRLPPPPPPPLPPPPPSTYINPNYPIKDSSEMYRSNQFAAYHPETHPSREKTICTASNLRSHRNNNHCNNRGQMWPVHFQYPSVSQNSMNTYDHRINYHPESQSSGCCIIRHEKPTDLYGNYKYVSTQHIPYRTDTTDMCSAYAPVLFNDRVNYSTPQQQDYPEQNGTICYKVDSSEMQKPICNQLNEIGGGGGGGGGNNLMETDYGGLKSYNDKIIAENNNYNTQDNVLYAAAAAAAADVNNIITKKQNLREFLSSWNEDEDDGIDKLDTNLVDSNDDIFLDSTPRIESENTSLENQFQYNGQFLKPRPKIHLGITVDSNVVNDQFINLPDIIIDIEKSKDTENILQSDGQNLNNDKVLFNNPIDISKKDLNTLNTEDNINEINLDAASSSNKNKKDYKSKNDKKKKILTQGWVKIQGRRSVCKIKRICRKVIHKHCCKSMVKRKKNLYCKNKIIKDKIEEKMIPKTLKGTCISMINSEKFHQFMIENYNKHSRPCSPTRNFNKNYNPPDIIASDKNEELLCKPNDNRSTESIPKLSALCEDALNDFYEKGLLVINLEDESYNRLYVLECDINENLLESSESSIQLNYLEYNSDESNKTMTTTTSTPTSPPPPSSIYTTNTTINEYYPPPESHESIKDINSIHHEEIVPENYQAFENKKFLQYLQNKYVRRNSFLQNYVINGLLSKYKKLALRKKGKKITTPIKLSFNQRRRI